MKNSLAGFLWRGKGIFHWNGWNLFSFLMKGNDASGQIPAERTVHARAQSTSRLSPKPALAKTLQCCVGSQLQVSFKAKNSTQLKTKLFNLDFSQWFCCGFESEAKINNYRNCCACVTSTAVENSHPALDSNSEQILLTGLPLKNQMNFPLSYQEALLKYPLLEWNPPW